MYGLIYGMYVVASSIAQSKAESTGLVTVLRDV